MHRQLLQELTPNDDAVYPAESTRPIKQAISNSSLIHIPLFFIINDQLLKIKLMGHRQINNHKQQ